MRSLTILITSFLFTLTLASPDLGPGPVIQTSACPFQNLTIREREAINNVTFRLLSVSKANHSDQTALALKQETPLTLQRPELFYLATTNLSLSDAQNFTIINRVINALAPDGTVAAVSQVVNNGSFLPFVDASADENPADVYCWEVSPEILVNSSRVPVVEYSYTFTLAVNFRSDLFWLCESSFDSTEFDVVYNLNTSSPDVGYNVTSCDAVEIFVIPSP